MTVRAWTHHRGPSEADKSDFPAKVTCSGLRPERNPLSVRLGRLSWVRVLHPEQVRQFMNDRSAFSIVDKTAACDLGIEEVVVVLDLRRLGNSAHRRMRGRSTPRVPRHPIHTPHVPLDREISERRRRLPLHILSERSGELRTVGSLLTQLE